MEYKYQVCHWVEKGVPFSTHMYVPEIHPITGKEFHEREDFAHIMKVYMFFYSTFTSLGVFLFNILLYRECASAQGKEAHNQSGLKDFMRHYMMTSLD